MKVKDTTFIELRSC